MAKHIYGREMEVQFSWIGIPDRESWYRRIL